MATLLSTFGSLYQVYLQLRVTKGSADMFLDNLYAPMILSVINFQCSLGACEVVVGAM